MGLARLMGQRAPIAGLPPPNTKSWVARRKAAVVMAVCSGIITLEEACRHYQLSEEEFFAWQRAFETHGVQGLRATCVQKYRDVRSYRSASSVSSTETSAQRGFDRSVKDGPQGSSISWLLPAGLNPGQRRRPTRSRGHFRKDLKLKPQSAPIENR